MAGLKKDLLLTDLHSDTLLQICQYLDPDSMLALACTCRTLAAASSHPALWQALCEARWYHINAPRICSPDAPGELPAAVSAAASLPGNTSSTAPLDSSASPNSLVPEQADWTELRADAADPHAAQRSPPTTPRERPTEANTLPALPPQQQQRLEAQLAQAPPAPALPSAHTAAPDGSCRSWKQLYLLGNGWSPPRMAHTTLQPGGDFISAFQPVAMPTGGALLAVATSEELQLWRVRSAARMRGVEVSATSAAASSTSANGGRPKHSLDHHLLTATQTPGATTYYTLSFVPTAGSAPAPTATATAASAPAVAAGGLIAAGTSAGRLELWRIIPDLNLDPDNDQDPATAAAAGCSAGNRRGSRQRQQQGLQQLMSVPLAGALGQPLVDLRHMPSLGLLTGLHDCSFLQAGEPIHMHAAGAGAAAGAARNKIRIFDLAAQRDVVAVADVFESHEFMCFDLWGGGAAAGSEAVGGCSAGGEHELAVGSVHGGYCRHCFCNGLPSLCFHKPMSAVAAVVTLDLRAGGSRGGAVQRFTLHHRSLYPRVRTCRSTFLFTSHAGDSLAVWDRRAMSVPLHTEERLGYYHWSHTGLAVAPAAAGAEAAAGVVCPWSTGCGPRHHPGLMLDAGGLPPRPPMLVPEYAQLHPQHPSPGRCTAGDSGVGATEREGWPLVEAPQPDGDGDAGHNCAVAPAATAAASGGGFGHHDGSDPHSSLAAACGGGSSGDARHHYRYGQAPYLGYQQQQLQEWVFPAPWLAGIRRAEHQGLWLECSGDVLLGRAENGLTWLWDLSATLGWARPSHQGASITSSGAKLGISAINDGVEDADGEDFWQGSWFYRGGGGGGEPEQQQQQQEEEEDEGEEEEGKGDPRGGGGWHGGGGQGAGAGVRGGGGIAAHAGPMCLGALPCETSTPDLHLTLGLPHLLFSLASREGELQERIQVSRLW